MHVYFDTEFLERGPEHPVNLISIGMVAADGREYYAIDRGAPWNHIYDHVWLREHVLPYLPGEIRAQNTGFLPDLTSPAYRPRSLIRAQVDAFLFASITGPELGEPLDLWADCGGYDRVMLGQLWGTMSNFPSWLPYWQHDLRSVMALGHVPYNVLPPEPADAHNALGDARHLKAQVEAVVEYMAGRQHETFPVS